MKHKYTRTPLSTRILAIIVLALLLLSMIPVLFTSCDERSHNKKKVEIVTETMLEETVASYTTEVTSILVTEETTVTETEPEWEFIHIPLPPDYPDIESLVTIYDVYDAVRLCDEFVQELEPIISSTDVEHPQYKNLMDLHNNAKDIQTDYANILEDHWRIREQQRPVMTEVWRYLTSEGNLNEYVTAGIIGNMCAESGGQGYQDIDPYNWDGATGVSFYGACQWSVYYYPEIANSDLEYQLKYLMDSLEYNFTNWGYNYSNRYGSKFRTEQFLNMTDPYEAAIAFAVCYERCGSSSVELRGPLADKAYTYFTVLGSWPWYGPEPAVELE